MADAAEEKVYRFMPVAAEDAGHVEDLSQSAVHRILAVCIATQQRAGFRELLDMRLLKCPDCGAPGFNSGWGYWQFECGNEVLNGED